MRWERKKWGLQRIISKRSKTAIFVKCGKRKVRKHTSLAHRASRTLGCLGSSGVCAGSGTGVEVSVLRGLLLLLLRLQVFVVVIVAILAMGLGSR